MDNYQALKPLEKKLGYFFKNKEILLEALTHRSYKKPYSNERLEFLGDAVLDLIVGEFLFHRFPNVREGDLSKMRAVIVNEKGFSKLARRLSLGDFIYISVAEENNQGRKKPSLLSGAFEAIFGAIYLDSGAKEARRVMFKILEEIYTDVDIHSLLRDYKSVLQELTQKTYGEIPEYVLLGTHGPDHKKEFEVAVFILGQERACARGYNKKEAQQKAAKIAMAQLKRERALKG